MSSRIISLSGKTSGPGFRRAYSLKGLNPSLGVSGSLEVRLTTTKREIRQAQKLRYRIFLENGAGCPDATARLIRRDVCRFDRVCDHLVVLDHAVLDARGRPRLAGAYRLLRQDVAQANFGFYSADEFDIAPLLERHRDKRFLELGRSCVDPDYRGKRALDLLWRGIWTYVRHHQIDAIFGCASFAGTNPAEHGAAIGYLQSCAPARIEWKARAVPGRGIDVAALAPPPVEPRDAIRALPPLLRGYWRVGAQFGAEAVVDAAFGTTDLFVIMPVAEIDKRYIQYFSDQGESAPIAA
jgi:putative hemolysin